MAKKKTTTISVQTQARKAKNTKAKWATKKEI